MARYIYRPDVHDEPTIWIDKHGRLKPVISRYQIRDDATWRLIVGALCGEVPTS